MVGNFLLHLMRLNLELNQHCREKTHQKRKCKDQVDRSLTRKIRWTHANWQSKRFRTKFL